MERAYEKRTVNWTFKNRIKIFKWFFEFLVETVQTQIRRLYKVYTMNDAKSNKRVKSRQIQLMWLDIESEH